MNDAAGGLDEIEVAEHCRTVCADALKEAQDAVNALGQLAPGKFDASGASPELCRRRNCLPNPCIPTGSTRPCNRRSSRLCAKHAQTFSQIAWMSAARPSLRL